MVSPISYRYSQSQKVPSAPNDPKMKLNGTTSRSNVLHISWTTTLESQISSCFVLRSLVFQTIEVSGFFNGEFEIFEKNSLKLTQSNLKNSRILETAALRAKKSSDFDPLRQKGSIYMCNFRNFGQWAMKFHGNFEKVHYLRNDSP